MKQKEMLMGFGALNAADFKKNLIHRKEKQKAFFKRKKKGDLLLYINLDRRGIPLIERYLYNLVSNIDVEELYDKRKIESIALNYITQLRQSFYVFYLVDDDLLPALTDVFFGTGTITGSMTQNKISFSNQVDWSRSELGWDEIEKLKFNPDNIWIKFSLSIFKALIKFWDEDFLMGGYRYRSPLDAAWGIRGSAMFEEMYTEPEKVKDLIGWCTDWNVSLEKLIEEEIDLPSGFKGMMGTLIQDGAVFVNGDPIDLINNELARIFDIPYSSKFFSAIGGGFYHHHSIGAHQVLEISKIKDLSVQQISNDYPASKDLAEILIKNIDLRNKTIDSSLIKPVMLDGIRYKYIDKLSSVLKEGRFILSVVCDDYKDTKECIEKIKKINNLK